jgi:hypothetical protein
MRTLGIIVATVLAAGVLGSASAQTISFTVDCSKGQAIGAALQRGDARKPLLLMIRGTCNESVSIDRGDVTLRGQPGGGATVSGPSSTIDTIVILDDTVNIEDLTVTGGNNGIRLQGPFYAGVRNVHVRNTAGNGILVRAGDIAIDSSTVEYAAGSGVMLSRGASARIVNSSFRYSHMSGITADNNSTVGMNGGTVSNSEGHGITVGNGSQGNVSNVEIFGNTTGFQVSASQASLGGGNFIHHNREHGVLAQAGSVVGVDNNTIADNGQIGVFGYLGSTVVMHGNEITDNTGTGVACRTHGTLQIGGAHITRNSDHGVVVQLRSTLILEEPRTDGSGNYGWVDLWCGDKESSVDLGSNFSGTVSDTCTGFD